jgi:uncharacterized protein
MVSVFMSARSSAGTASCSESRALEKKCRGGNAVERDPPDRPEEERTAVSAPVRVRVHPAARRARKSVMEAAPEPFREEELEDLDKMLAKRSPLGVDAVLGLLHAVAVSPATIAPTTWLPIILPGGPGADRAEAERALGMVFRLYNEIIRNVGSRDLSWLPDEEDVDGCKEFAAGYVEGATLDAEWVGDEERWSYATWAAYLGDRQDLVPAPLLDKLDKNEKKASAMLREDMADAILEAYNAFLPLRGAPPGTKLPRNEPVRSTRIGRNDPCPCGSGKKYKRCCIGGAPPGAS